MLGRYLFVPILLMGLSSSALADDTPWTLDRVIATARTNAPATSIARAQTEESKAALVGAQQLQTRNPYLQADVGPRFADGTSTDIQSQLSVPFDVIGDRRAKRVAVAEAEIATLVLASDVVARQSVVRAAAAFYALLHAQQRVALGEERVQLAASAETTAVQRKQAGDVAEFEVNLARGERARAKGAVASAQADISRARGELAIALGVPTKELTSVAGDLADRALFEQATTTSRPDLQALEQEARLARAEAELARTDRLPMLDLRLSFEHERDANIVLGGIGISFPIFERGQADAAKATARVKRAQAELAARTSAVSVQVESAQTTYVACVEAARLLEDEAVPLAVANEAAAAASYRAGKIDFATLIVIRREALETRREHLDRLLEAARAGLELWAAQGATP